MPRLIVAFCLVFFVVFAQAETLKAGSYAMLPLSSNVLLKADKPGDVKVTEFFSLACPHCAKFDPSIEKWLKTKPKYVEFQRIPVGFGRELWKVLARTYYVSVALGDEKTMTALMFKALHEQNLPLYSAKAIAQFFAQHGVSEATFMKYYDSYSIIQQVKQGDDLVKKTGIMGVPTIVVNGEYRTGPELAGNFKNIIATMNGLIAKVHQDSANT